MGCFRKRLMAVDDGGLPEPVGLGSPVASSSSQAVGASSSAVTLPADTSNERAVVTSNASTFSGTAYEDPTVTPLHLLGDQSDFVDCPFCRRRVETRVKKKASAATQYATLPFL
jgi:hypothetical protein